MAAAATNQNPRCEQRRSQSKLFVENARHPAAAVVLAVVLAVVVLCRGGPVQSQSWPPADRYCLFCLFFSLSLLFLPLSMHSTQNQMIKRSNFHVRSRAALSGELVTL